MPPTLISRKSNNWVDRGEAPDGTLRRVLAYHFGKHGVDDLVWLQERAMAVLAMVQADANEVELTSYLRSISRELGLPDGEPAGTRGVAVSLWHIAKVALVRDLAERVLRGDVPANIPTEGKLGDWLAAKLLTPDELAEHEAERRAAAEGEGAG